MLQNQFGNYFLLKNAYYPRTAKERKIGILEISYSVDPNTRLTWYWNGGHKFGVKNIHFLAFFKVGNILRVLLHGHLAVYFESTCQLTASSCTLVTQFLQSVVNY